MGSSIGCAGRAIVAAVCIAAMPGVAAQAQSSAPANGDAELAKKINNPISDLVSVPFQFNWENGIGVPDQTRYILNIQPVMPFALNDSTNMIVRLIAPLVSQPPAVDGGLGTSGVSDVLASFFFSPAHGAITWGVGPAVSVPSTSVPTLGTGKWSAGPTAVVLKQAHGWTYGILMNQIWSFAGDTTRPDVSQMFLEPFVAFTTKNLWTITVQSESTKDWKADGANSWNAPLNVLLAKLSTFGVFPASYQFGGGWFFAKPENGATWKVRAAISILLPKKEK